MCVPIYELYESLFTSRETKLFAVARDRTGDIQIFSLTLSQLSYNGITYIVEAENIYNWYKKNMAETGFEPAPPKRSGP